MDPCEFGEVGHRVVDLLSDYFEHIEEKCVFPDVEPTAIQSSGVDDDLDHRKHALN
jgi:hypothetical protein